MGYNLKPAYTSVDELQSRDRAISILYGRQPDPLGGNIIPINVDASGNLVIGSGLVLNTDDIDIGDIVLKGITSAAGPGLADDTEVRLGARAATGQPAGLYSLFTEDPRLTFTASALHVNAVSLADGGNSITVDALDLDIRNLLFTQDSVEARQTTHDNLNLNANVQVADVDASNANPLPNLSADKTFITEAYVTVDAYANARSINGNLAVARYKTKEIIVKNTGGVNAARVTITGSVDNGVNFDVTISNNTLVAVGNTLEVSENRAFTHIKIEARSNTAGNATTVESRAYVLGS